MKQYFVIYKEYQEYNQFEGTWNTDYEVYTKLKLAYEFINTLQNDENYRDIVGPLVSVN